MADEKKTDKPETRAVKKEGFDKPIEDPGDPSKVPSYIHPETLMVKGIAPDSKERVAINLEALKYEFGEKVALKKYGKIARAGGFLDPNQSPSGEQFYPDLSLDGLKPSVRQEIDAILKQE